MAVNFLVQRPLAAALAGGMLLATLNPTLAETAKHKKTAPAAAPIVYVPPPFVSIDVPSGRVIEARDAGRRWYPASVTKLMTVYVALQAVQDGRLSLDTPLVVSARAARMKPSKMGFAPGVQITLGNALKILMVKSANDVSVTVAEGVSGSVEAFASEMNATAARLGMTESHFVNPNGLADPNHYSSPRDMAMLGRALLLQYPQYAGLFDIGALQYGEQVIPNHNGLIGRYPGADGMKTGFTCPAGFNLVASATRGDRRVIVVVFGDLTAKIRTAHAADLLDRAFAASQLGEPINEIAPVPGAPPDLHQQICTGRSAQMLLAAESEDFGAPIQVPFGATAPTPGAGAAIAALPRPEFQPTPIFVGPVAGYQGPVAGPRPPNTPIGAIAYAPPAPEPAPTALKPDPKAQGFKKPAVKAHEAAAHHDPKAKAKDEPKHDAAKGNAVKKPAADHKNGKSAAAHDKGDDN